MNKKITSVIDLQGREAKCIVWMPDDDTSARCILQLSHGMEEHIERYEDFAEYLCDNGYIVFGSDQVGHGVTLSRDELGYFGEGGYKGCIDRLHCVTLKAKQMYPDLPLVLLGHSMGSFMARGYITRYGKEINGAIIMGTSGPNPALGMGKLLVKIITAFKGEHQKSEFIKKMMFGSYNKKFDGDGAYKWLTKRGDIQTEYERDEYCGFGFTLDGYKAVLGILSEVSSPKWAEAVPKKLPVLLISGADDPVGDYSKGVQ
ncbi:MAG: alpha/beta hydrolase, partial [Clostridia bacterium]|nr:alpha/beta hydrolase [Clostridia bacterium]